jgi:quinolinate synthase
VVRRPGCPHRPIIGSSTERLEGFDMLRLQAPIPERFIADDPANDARIRAAREAEVKELTFLLWRGHCSVHQRFTPALVEGRVENRITVDGETARWARVALDRMLSIT